MLDFSRLTTLLELAGSALQGRSDEPLGLLDLIQSAGLDPSVLGGLGEGEILALLNEQGIDVSQLTAGDIGEVLEGLGLGNGAASIETMASVANVYRS